MSIFDVAYNKVLNNEGSYANHRLDTGGETYCGISRKWNPLWEGWHIIDRYKDDHRFPIILEELPQLRGMVKFFYKKEYWDKLSIDTINSIDLSIQMFDAAINCGVKNAGMFLQRVLNYLNIDGNLYNDLIVDGLIGAKTLRAYDILLSRGDSIFIFSAYRGERYSYYKDIIEKNETQEIFFRSWLRRI